jgi:chemotaxis protein histidine kinase CheA
MMEADELDFLANLKSEFVDEGLEHIEALEGIALDFERDGDPEEMTRFKRQIHSFKGSAQAVEEEAFAESLHHIESKLEKCIQESRLPDFMEFVYPAIDRMRDYVNSLENGGDPALLEAFVKLVADFN